jgi:NADH:ubiquinone oxidoreductase subunit 4 (subunit M)
MLSALSVIFVFVFYEEALVPVVTLLVFSHFCHKCRFFSKLVRYRVSV